MIDTTVTTDADPAAVYALLADGSTWPEWSPIGSFALVDPGDGTPEGLGAVRLFTTGRHKSRSASWSAARASPSRYVLEAGLALRDYRAVVTLTPTASGGTSINWRSTFRAKVPGSGWVYRRQLGKFIGETVAGLAAAADRARGSRTSYIEALAGAGRVLRAGLLGPFEAHEGQPELGERLEQGRLGLAEAAAEPVEQGAEAVDGQAGLEEHRRCLREVDGGQLEEPVAVVGHHDLGRGAGQLGPHGVDLRLRLGLLVWRIGAAAAGPGGWRRVGAGALLLGEMLARRCPEAAHAGTVCHP